MIRIKTIMENTLSVNRILKAEHGLSFLIEKDDKRILFDCGNGAATLYNAQKMGVDVLKLDGVVLSHSHYDHAGGFYELVAKGYRGPVYIGARFWEEKYAYDGKGYTYLGCGFNQTYLEEQHVVWHICYDKYTLSEGMYIVGCFKHYYEDEAITKRFVKDTKEGMIADDFSDEICIVLETEKGLVVVLGCSHPGILNMLTTITEQFAQPLYAVFGGAHLSKVQEKRLYQTTKVLQMMGVQIIGLNHCTGDEAIKVMKEEMIGVSFPRLNVGDCYHF